jgi:hypothetical protein
MRLKELKALSERVKEFKDVVQGEQHTKNVLIEPMLKLLGFDIANPFDIITEYTCDFGVKKGEKVDYALMQDKELVMLVEAKDCKFKLDKRNISQLFRYYSVSQARLALLTNGVDYLFFMDTVQQNTMDMEPFFSFNVLDFSEKDFEMLSMFKKDVVSVDELRLKALSTIFSESITEYFIQQAIAPSSDFVSFVTRNLGLSGVNTLDATKLLGRELTRLLKNKIDVSPVKAVSASNEEVEPEEELEVVTDADTPKLSGVIMLSEFNSKNVIGTKPTNLLVGNKQYEVKTWSDIVASVVEHAFFLGNAIEFVCNLDGVTEEDKGWVRTNSINMRTPRELVGKGVFVDVHSSAYQLMTRTRSILGKLGVNSSEVLVELK